jgi:hypothetical protein
MTYTSYTHSHQANNAFRNRVPLDVRLSPTSVPLLIIFGAEDRLVDPKGAEAFRDVPGAQIELIQGAGHSPQFEKPAETARLIEDFTAPIAAAEIKARREAEARAKRKAAEARRKRQAKKRVASKRANQKKKTQGKQRAKR